MELAFLVIGWLGCGIIAAIVGQSKGRGAGDSFMFGAVFGIFGLAYVALSNPPAPLGMKHVQCPRCNAKQNIPAEGGECWQCRTAIAGKPRRSTNATDQHSTRPSETGAIMPHKVTVTCPKCKAKLTVKPKPGRPQFKCPDCGALGNVPIHA